MLKQFVKYNTVGIVNTLLGFSIIFILMFLGVSPMISNAVGYGIGAIFSYYLNSKYTFQDTPHSYIRMFKFFMILSLSYLLNFLVLQWLLPFLNPYIAQFISAVVYTLSSFFFMKFFVFR